MMCTASYHTTFPSEENHPHSFPHKTKPSNQNTYKYHRERLTGALKSYFHNSRLCANASRMLHVTRQGCPWHVAWHLQRDTVPLKSSHQSPISSSTLDHYHPQTNLTNNKLKPLLELLTWVYFFPQINLFSLLLFPTREHTFLPLYLYPFPLNICNCTFVIRI